MAKLQAAGKTAAASVLIRMVGLERDMAGLEAMFDRATSGIAGSVDRLNADTVRGQPPPPLDARPGRLALARRIGLVSTFSPHGKAHGS
ncbi:hypothetical protein ACP4J4_10520 [Aureimonas ureilytica]|uniref:hypothetical protein n=1 Tax=Aureimonas ureilytica TaxID=401562 RepID=UPI003CE74A83